jgi:hypothetical protein
MDRDEDLFTNHQNDINDDDEMEIEIDGEVPEYTEEDAEEAMSILEEQDEINSHP